MDGIADGVRWRTGRYDQLSVAEMVAELKKNYGVNRDMQIDILPDEVDWVRPADWPDLDSLNLEMAGDDFIYMTYDANESASAIVWHIETADKEPATLDIGHIENGMYIADETYSVKHNTDFVKWTDDYSGYLVLRITGPITYCYSKNATRNGQTQYFRLQPILERIAWVPHLIKFCTGYTSNAWGMFTLEREKIANGDGEDLISLYYAWGYCRRLISLDISGLYAPNVKDMSCVFYQCRVLKELDLRHWNVRMANAYSSVFSGCRSLQTLNLAGWTLEGATSIISMFNDCRSLKQINGIEDFDTSRVIDMRNTFQDCSSLETIPVENWDTGQCTQMSNMFYNCQSLRELDLSSWNVENVTTVNGMFNNCFNLKRINFNGWRTGELTTAGNIFSGCRGLESLDVSWLHITNKCTNINGLFNGCWSLKELDIPDDWDVSGLADTNNSGNSIFAYCYSLERITGIRNWQFSFSNSLTSEFYCCWSLKEVDVSGWKTDAATHLSSVFYECYSLESLDLSNWKTDNCTTFSSMFQRCWSLKSIGDISGWDTSEVTGFNSMFSECLCLPEIPDISKWSFDKATTLSGMFSTCSSLREIAICNLKLPECTNVSAMFQYCYLLQKATLTGWSIPKMTTAPGQFLGQCNDLRDLEIDIPFALNHSYASCEALSHESLINILNSLPAVSTRRTLNLMTQNINRLTAEEKAIAANKNWTLAN